MKRSMAGERDDGGGGGRVLSPGFGAGSTAGDPVAGGGDWAAPGAGPSQESSTATTAIDGHAGLSIMGTPIRSLARRRDDRIGRPRGAGPCASTTLRVGRNDD